MGVPLRRTLLASFAVVAMAAGAIGIAAPAALWPPALAVALVLMWLLAGRIVRPILDRLEEERNERGRLAISIQEAERLRVAQELHDEVGQTLTAVLLTLEGAMAGADDELRAKLLEAQQAVRVGLENVRRICRHLRPEALDDHGLVSALAIMAKRFADRGGVEIDTRLSSELPTLTAAEELVVYRVAQEALTNVARHSKTSRVLLSLGRNDGALELLVADEGKGFGASPWGSGLRGMRERATHVGAELSVHDRPGGGVLVRMRLPST